MKTPIKSNVLVIADTHLPFEIKNYLDFCLDVGARCRCGTIVHIGDLVDNHSISYHEHDPNGKSPLDEMAEVDKHLKDWFKKIPSLYLCLGNHDRMVDRKSRTVGLPDRVFKGFREIWNLPKGWITDFSFEFQGVRFTHGSGYCGKYSHVQVAYDSRQSAVVGHTHSTGAVQYIDSKGCIFGMNCGCGIDRTKYAFAYGKDFRFKPLVGCGVVTDNGKFRQFFPMSI